MSLTSLSSSKLREHQALWRWERPRSLQQSSKSYMWIGIARAGLTQLSFRLFLLISAWTLIVKTMIYHRHSNWSDRKKLAGRKFIVESVWGNNELRITTGIFYFPAVWVFQTPCGMENLVCLTRRAVRSNWPRGVSGFWRIRYTIAIISIPKMTSMKLSMPKPNRVRTSSCMPR